MVKKTKIDEIVKVCIEWNNRKITAKDAMFKIWKINEEYILSELNPKPQLKRKCKWCGKRLPLRNISYCNRECKKNDLKTRGGNNE